MKIFRITQYNDKFWRAVTNIGGVDVIHIDSDNYEHKEDTSRVNSRHFITYDIKDRRAIVCGMSNLSETIMLIKDKILSRIQENEDIIFIGKDFYNNDFLKQLKKEKEFNLHLVKEIYDKTDDDEYLPHLRRENNLEIFNSIYCINSYTFLHDIKHTDEERKLYSEYVVDELKKVVGAVSEVEQGKQMIYNHKLKKYRQLILPKDFVFLVNESKCLFERVISTDNNGKEICTQFKRYRSEYAKNMFSKTRNRKCEYKGSCKGVCKICDGESEYIWETKNKNIIIENSKEYSHNEIIGIFNGIERLRIDTDGKGVRALVLMSDCLLECKYCCNKGINKVFPRNAEKTPLKLGEHLHKDGIYFEKTGGGVTFGGGEPLLQADFIVQFSKIYSMWNIDIETSLNMDYSEIEKLVDIIDVWHIDIKDMDPTIYKNYTGFDNSLVMENLKKLVNAVPTEKLHIRVPRIKGYNTSNDIYKSIETLKAMGFTEIEVFDYIVEE